MAAPAAVITSTLQLERKREMVAKKKKKKYFALKDNS